MMNITRKKAVQLMLAATCAWLATGCMQEEWERPEQKVKTTICADIPSEDEDVQTRVTVDRTNYKLYWSENDEITVVGFDESDRFKGLEIVASVNRTSPSLDCLRTPSRWDNRLHV